MPEIVGSPNSRSLPEVLEELGTAETSRLRAGFSRFIQASADARAKATRIAIELAEAAETSITMDQATSRIGVPAADAFLLLRVASFSAAAIVATGAAPQQYADEVIRVFELPSDARAVLEEVCQSILSASAGIVEASRSAGIAARGLPALTRFGATLDIRLAFEEDRLSAAVPVVLASIDTDEATEPFHFQMSEKQVRAVLETLTTVVERLKVAEDLSTAMLARKG
jgi:hypothetical protein